MLVRVVSSDTDRTKLDRSGQQLELLRFFTYYAVAPISYVLLTLGQTCKPSFLPENKIPLAAFYSKLGGSHIW